MKVRLTSDDCRYGAEQGKQELRSAICQKLYSKAGRKPSEVFVSDGSKCDIGRLQVASSASMKPLFVSNEP